MIRIKLIHRKANSGVAGPGLYGVNFPSAHSPIASRFRFQAYAYSPSTRRRLAHFIGMLVGDSRTSSANGAFGRQDRQDCVGMGLVRAPCGAGLADENLDLNQITKSCDRF